MAAWLSASNPSSVFCPEAEVCRNEPIKQEGAEVQLFPEGCHQGFLPAPGKQHLSPAAVTSIWISGNTWWDHPGEEPMEKLPASPAASPSSSLWHHPASAGPVQIYVKPPLAVPSGALFFLVEEPLKPLTEAQILLWNLLSWSQRNPRLNYGWYRSFPSVRIACAIWRKYSVKIWLISDLCSKCSIGLLFFAIIGDFSF